MALISAHNSSLQGNFSPECVYEIVYRNVKMVYHLIFGETGLINRATRYTQDYESLFVMFVVLSLSLLNKHNLTSDWPTDFSLCLQSILCSGEFSIKSPTEIFKRGVVAEALISGIAGTGAISNLLGFALENRDD